MAQVNGLHNYLPGEGSRIKILKELRFPHSVGLLYSAFTYYLGFKVNSGEYKLMGLAPYGNPASAQTAALKEKILQNWLILGKTDPSYSTCSISITQRG